MKFRLKSSLIPAGDQPKAISRICGNFQSKKKQQVLLGVTGSGKTLTMAHVIARIGEPALVLAPNKTLAAQLFVEFKELFPENAVEYFVSYYDYYQPEAYIPASNTYIEKDASVNEQIDLMRHSATRSLLERGDVIIVSSISCIYGLGSPEHYGGLVVSLEKNQKLNRTQFLKQLVEIQYRRSDGDFHRGSFRVRGDTVDVFPAYQRDLALRVEFFGDYVDRLTFFDPVEGRSVGDCLRISIYPSSHYVITRERMKKAVQSIRRELKDRLAVLEKEGRGLETDRLKRRTLYDLEILSEMGSCPGVENYSRHFTGQKPGEPPPTLLEYFTKNFLTFIDESHITVPQAGGMYRGDRRRKLTLVEHGFRLPSALDNRPLNFEEFESRLDKVVYVSATPGQYERERSVVVEQIIRPTGLIDPEIFIRPARNQVEDLLKEIQKRIRRKERVLVTTLTKKAAESLTAYCQGLNIKAKYLHSDIKTIERTEILQDLRAGIFDVLVGINLLREGLDLPEVSLVAVLDADREGFLRSTSSLVQTIGRAARHIRGKAILYADQATPSIQQAVFETNRRRKLQKEHNDTFHIQPKSIRKRPRRGLAEIYGFDKSLEFSADFKPSSETVRKKISDLKKQMKKSAGELNFEEAARLRDRIKGLELTELEFSDP